MLLIQTCATAQDRGLSELLKVVFHDKRVSEKVFIDYKGIGNGPFVLQPGKYAFIFTDSVFAQCYPRIHEDLAWSWSIYRLVHTLPYVQNDSSMVFVTYYMDNNIPFNIIFDEIQILETDARLRFRTSCDCQERTVGTIYRFDVTLIRREKKWMITKLDSQTQYGCVWTYPEKIRKENIIIIDIKRH